MVQLSLKAGIGRAEIDFWLAWQSLQGIYHRLHALAQLICPVRPIVSLAVIGSQLDYHNVLD